MKSLSKIFSFLTKPANAIWTIGFVVLAISFGGHFKPGNSNFWKDTVASDGRGYYAYLPSLVLYGEFDFEKVLQREKEIYPAMMAGTFMTEVDGKPVNKYFAGVALLLLPFFLLAAFLSSIAGLPVDGYNAVFQMMVSIAGIFYLILGLFFTWKLLEKFKIPDGVVVYSLWVVVFGTNLLVYTLDAPAMSHVFSFAAIAGFLFFTKAFFDSYKIKEALLAVFSLGIIILIRPVNGIIFLLIPFMAGSPRGFSNGFSGFFNNIKIWLPAIIIISFLMLIQSLLWYFQTGSCLVWSYQGEGFNFLRPEISKVLFSYQKGFFIYTPVAFFALLGMVVFFRESKWQFFWLLGFMVVLTWLVSSWWNWYYGDSFGQRVFIDFYALLALLLAFSIKGFSKKFVKISLITLLVVLSLINLVQIWQYSHGIIHAYAMNKEKYWHVFLKTGNMYRNLFSGPVDVPPYKTDLTKSLRVYQNNFEQEVAGWISSGRTGYSGARSGNFVTELNQHQQYSSALLITGDTLLTGRRDLYARVVVFILDKSKEASTSSKLVVSLANPEGVNYYLNSWAVNEMPQNEYGVWRRIEFGFQLPEIVDVNDQMKIFIWQKGTGTLLVDDFGISIYGQKQ